MRIAITYGFHRNEYTAPVAKETAGILRANGHQVTAIKVPFSLTAWGVAMEGCDLQDFIKTAYGAVYENDADWLPDSDLVFDFHATPESVLGCEGLLAESLQFAINENSSFIMKKGNIVYIPWDCDREYKRSDLRRGFWIELPQVYRNASQGFLSMMHRRSYEITLNPYIYDRFVMWVADKPATLRKYPPEVLGKIIADGIEEQIISAPAAP
ncbi:MAG: hypothetical protein FJY76_01470 [Candidatus Aenigmarchaeota archaeon]|nr:hypothetical protein [Candidatus Aenigmarchaeota archaeon]